MNCSCGGKTRVINLERRADGAHRWRRCLLCDSLLRTVERRYNPTARRVFNESSPTTQGERNPSAVLTTEDVRELRAERAAGSTYRQLSHRFGIALTTVADIVHHRTWKHVS